MLSRRLLLGGLLLPSVARAHGFHAAFSVLELNPRTGALEIIHRIFIQDIEILLTARAGTTIALSETATSQKLVESYLLDVFSLKTADGRALKPTWVGFKLQIDTMFVYQELKDAAGLNALLINDQILTETHPGQVNTVNLTVKGRTQTLLFTINDGAQMVTL